MPRVKLLLSFIPLATLNVLALAQQPAAARPQSARQALIEVITGGETGLRKHLTVEVLQSLKKAGNERAAAILKGIGANGLGAAEGMQVFDTGPVLLAFNEPAEHKKLEVHVDNDDLSGEEDTLELSFHSISDGQEQSEPWQFVLSRFSVGMKRQQGIWRINKISVGTDLAVGDPEFLEKLFNPATATGGGMYGVKVGHGGAQAEKTEPAKLDPATVVAMLALAEGTYATDHPESGFTCSLPDLLDASKVYFSTFTMDPELANGRANGYKFAITGCEGKPAGSFQISAEPQVVTPGAMAFCTDATRNVRVSEDGRSATCISSGKTPGATQEKVFVPEVHTDFKPEH